MENTLKKLFNNIHPINIIKLLENNISDIIRDDKEKRITIYVNKKYVMKDLLKSDNLSDLIKAVHNTFWEEYSTSFKLRPDIITHDREMLVPHTIHF